MPYWQRQEILTKNLNRYRELYGDSIEIIVVDDGSPQPARVIGGVKLIRLPRKNVALNPCIPYNIAAKESSGDYILFTNPETYHTAPIIDGMRKALDDLGPLGHVAAACKTELRENWWHCHSTMAPSNQRLGRGPMPDDSGLHFCAMVHRSLWEKIGGFHEEYRQGQGFEDNDILWKLDAAGAKFRILDNLVTIHMKCPPCKWPPGGHARNKAIFERRWPEAVRINDEKVAALK